MSTRGIHENPCKHWLFCTLRPDALSYLTAYRVRPLHVVVYRALWKGSCVSRPSPRHPRPCRTCQVVAIGFFLLANSGDVDRPPDLRPPERLTPICNADLATTMTPCSSVSPGNSGDVDRPASAGGDHGNQYTGGKSAVVENVPQPARSRDQAAAAEGIPRS